MAHAQAAGVTRYWAKKRTPTEALPVPVVTAPVPVVNHAEPLSMSTREIAELTGKRHSHVLYDTRVMLEALKRTPAEFSAHVQIPGPNGASRPSLVFNLPKDLTLTLVSGYNVQMRHRIITRWLELEDAAKAPQVPAIAAPRALSEALFLVAKRAAEQEQRMTSQQSNIVAIPQGLVRVRCDRNKWWPLGEPAVASSALSDAEAAAPVLALLSPP